MPPKIFLLALLAFFAGCAGEGDAVSSAGTVPDDPEHTLSVEDYLERAASANLAGDYDSAISDAGTALSKDPSYWKAYSILGAALYGAGHHDDALKQLDTAIKIHPHHAPTYLVRGNVYLKLGDSAAAERDFKESRKLEMTAGANP